MGGQKTLDRCCLLVEVWRFLNGVLIDEKITYIGLLYGLLWKVTWSSHLMGDLCAYNTRILNIWQTKVVYGPIWQKTQGTESLVTILVWQVNPLAKSLFLFIALTKDILLSIPYIGLFFWWRRTASREVEACWKAICTSPITLVHDMQPPVRPGSLSSTHIMCWENLLGAICNPYGTLFTLHWPALLRPGTESVYTLCPSWLHCLHNPKTAASYCYPTLTKLWVYWRYCCCYLVCPGLCFLILLLYALSKKENSITHHTKKLCLKCTRA